MNIYCIGRNYVKHANELGNDVPKQPIIFLKPSHALITTRGQQIPLPISQGVIHHEIEVVLKIGKGVKPGESVRDVVSEVALGADLTLRDIQTELKEKGHPWLRAKGFSNSAIVTPFWAFNETEIRETEFSFVKNGELEQKGSITNMIFDFQAMIDECAKYFGLGEGDLIFTGTPEGVGPLHSGDVCHLFWGSEEKGMFTVE